MTNEEIVRSYKNAIDQSEQVGILVDLAQKPESEIIQILEDAGLKVKKHRKTNGPRTKVSDEAIAEIVEMRKQGMTLKQISKQTGLSPATVGRYQLGNGQPEQKPIKKNPVTHDQPAPTPAPPVRLKVEQKVMGIRNGVVSTIRKFLEDYPEEIEFSCAADGISFTFSAKGEMISISAMGKRESNV